MNDWLNGGGILGGIVALLTSIGWWMRRERVESAKADEKVAMSRASENKHDGQADEIEALRKRIEALDHSQVEQAVLINEQKGQIAKVEAKIIGLSMHFANLLLCDECKEKNRRVIEAIERLLEAHVQ